MIKNPHTNPKSWAYEAWEEGYFACVDDCNPYLDDDETLAIIWQDGKESGVLDRYLGHKIGELDSCLM